MFRKKKRLNPAQYEGMIDNMKKRIMHLQAQNRGLRQLVDCAEHNNYSLLARASWGAAL